jgi:hypothetical protein
MTSHNIIEQLQKAKIKHNNFYDYKLVKPPNARCKVKIRCPKHGFFEQRWDSHYLGGHGCTQCWQENINGGLTKNNYIKLANNRPAKLYLVVKFLDNEIFLKVGITINSVKKRFCNNGTPYDFIVLRLMYGEASNIWQQEKYLKNILKKYKYIPKLKFVGYTECYTLQAILMCLHFFKNTNK